PFYARAPSRSEQERIEPELARGARKPPAAWQEVPLEPAPDFARMLLSAADTPQGFRAAGGEIFRGRAMVKSGFAFLSFFEVEGRRFGLSVDLDVMPLERLQPLVPSTFAGVPLGDGVELPVVFALTKTAVLYAGQPGAGLRALRPLAYREAVPVSGRRVQVSGVGYYETTRGEWLRDEALVYVPPIRTLPGWVAPGRTWIDVSILKQTLTAYEGDNPVYVTLVSTGVDGMGDPVETHSTVRGQFLIHTKHVTASMSGDELGDEYDLRDVPYVMYFNEGYALHAAYWHDGFGKPRSHGCVNLSPEDARWIFEWSEPQVPEAWHGALSLREGTLVYIHP
ncbi:MAG TPA: L,D-transpeptidase, partial [Polyangiaceae bacterium]|nr:L,D-transpeptidase [Polyangiaceae bacterium]